jgi:hypothetical protein
MTNKGTIERKTIQPLPQTDVNNIQLALADLKNARDRLRFAGADKGAAAVARSLKSVEGALRHAQNKVVRAAEKRVRDEARRREARLRTSGWRDYGNG